MTIDKSKFAPFSKKDEFLKIIHEELEKDADLYLMENIESFTNELQDKTISLMSDTSKTIIGTITRKQPKEKFTFTDHL